MTWRERGRGACREAGGCLDSVKRDLCFVIGGGD